MRRRSRFLELGYGIALLAAYVGAVVWLTWPLASRATTGLPGPKGVCWGDVPYSAWAMAWASRALVDPAVHLADANIYHPSRGTFFFGPGAFGALPYFAPVFLATASAALATNVTLLGGIALTAWGMHLVVRRWTGSLLAGVVAASVLLTNNWLTYVFVPTTPHMAALQCFPWILLGAATWKDRFPRTLRLLPLVVLQSLTDLVYVMPAVFGPLGVLAMGRLCRPATRAAGLRLAGVLGLAAVVLLPLYQPYLRTRAENPDLARQSVWADVSLHPELPAQLWAVDVPASVNPVLAGLIAAGLIALVTRRGRHGPDADAWRHGALWAGAGLYLSLAPVVRVNGTDITLPQAWVGAGAALYRTLRITNRVGVAGLMGLAVLAGVAFAEIAARIDAASPSGRRAAGLRGALAMAIVLGLYRVSLQPGASPMGGPYGVMPAPVVAPAVLEQVRRIGGPLLELPSSVSLPDVPQHAAAMYRSITHEQPILNGYSSYYPAAFAERMAIAMALPNPDALSTLARETGLRLVLVHLAKYPPPAQAAWETLAAEGMPGSALKLVARADGALLFAVVPVGS